MLMREIEQLKMENSKAESLFIKKTGELQNKLDEQSRQSLNIIQGLEAKVVEKEGLILKERNFKELRISGL